ncbi:cysteine-rich receptor-like protein kinase 2 isoform X2 [Rhododendron vialii]|uniref:cysteine-rich receptor-like protein kinase 2 isoform X2 n=1 Tax=Rhododendron vialii TaxID=182163 RepID=UPI00265D8A2B|nr:cysteine-rich receptor-like protein kinase 2 isoform X2 [Rhododendron vialii]
MRASPINTMAPQLLQFRQLWRYPIKAVTLTVVLTTTAMLNLVAADPQTNLLNKGCSQYNATNLSNFYTNLNDTFFQLRSQLSGVNTKFATGQLAKGSDPVYAMAQCRDYLSTTDCVACFDVAVVLIRNCTGANGARVIYDGCFLRYESSTFYNQTTLPGNMGICGNDTAAQPTAFQTAAQGLLTDLETATPRINGYFAAATREVSGGGGTVYAVTQCAQSVSESGCLGCLQVAYGNIQSCPPDTDGRAVDAGCFFRYSDTAFFGANQTTNITPFLGVGGEIIGASELQGPTTFSYKDLKSATNNFSNETKLGEGGFGDVYKGTLKNGNVVAVKKLVMETSRAKADFATEVKLISNVHHRNLLRLLGCSTKGPDLLLVYDYMENGSLDQFLYGEMRGTLNWNQRFDIIFGTARGLAYLHDQFHVTIIHRDIKCSNILLDHELQPKIADFGLARLLPEGQSHLSTKFAGTLGYTAPEYAIHGQLTEKVDTYSFGIVVLEIISGRKCSETKTVEDEPVAEYLLEQAWKLYENDLHSKLVDEILVVSDGYTEEAAKKIIELALMCTQTPASSRPSMSEVVMLLSDRSMDLTMRPGRHAFMDKDKKIRNDASTTPDSSTSNATASFTEFSGR